ncbi:MAG: nucleotidyl transferase AbiEii/AbiGii toxin family protein [Acidobacteriota bacterium]
MPACTADRGAPRLSLVGGTALRFLFGLPRFSEHLDFSLEDGACFDPLKWMERLKCDLALSGREVELRWGDVRTVHVAWGEGSISLRLIGWDSACRHVLPMAENRTAPPSRLDARSAGRVR